eukprot:Clim_evm4s79 gene=Clim_evmTU4s79
MVSSPGCTCKCSTLQPKLENGELVYTFDDCTCDRLCSAGPIDDPKRKHLEKLPQVPANQMVTILVKDIVCPGCASALKRALLTDRRVLVVLVVLHTGETTIHLSVPKTPRVLKSLRTLIERAGFEIGSPSDLPSGITVTNIDTLPSDSNDMSIIQGADSAWSKAAQKTVYNVQGLTCEGCVVNLEKGLGKIPGIRDVKVNLVTEKVIVVHDTDSQLILAAFQEMGYRGEVAPSADDCVVIYDVEELRSSDPAVRSVALSHIQQCLGNMEGISSFRVLQGSDDGKSMQKMENALEVVYKPMIVGGRDILQALQSPMAKEKDHDCLLTVSLSKDQKAERKAAIRVAERRRQSREQIIGWSLAIPVFIISMVLGYIPQTSEELQHPIGPFELKTVLLFFLATPVQFWYGREFYTGAWVALKHGYANMDVLIALGSSAAYFYSIVSVILGAVNDSYTVEEYFETSVFIIMFVGLGKYLEVRARDNAGNAISKLMELGAKEAILLHMDPRTAAVISEEVIPVDLLQLNDIVKVLPGTKVPSDGVVQRGSGHVDESMMTGESIPVLKEKGSQVIGGSVNREGVLQVRIGALGNDLAINQIRRLIEEAQGSRAPIAKIADRISAVFVPIVVAIAIVTFVVWLLAALYILDSLPHDLDPFSFSLLFFISVLVVACPCALGVAVPIAIMVGTSLSAREGILIRGGEPLENTHRIDALIFDKTGTLTYGKLEVTDWIKVKCHADDKGGKVSHENDTFLFEAAGSLEAGSEHPLGQAIAEYCRNQDAVRVGIDCINDFDALAGRGIQGSFSGAVVRIGNRRFMREMDVNVSKEIENKMIQLEQGGKTVMLMAVDGEVAVIIAAADTIREESAAVAAKLREFGIEIWMITGDNRHTAHAVAQHAGIENVFAEVMPEDKRNKVNELQEMGKTVAMVGDGVNDSPALAQADVGIAIGAGTDVAIETADIVLMKSDLADIVTAVDISRKTYSLILFNLVWAFGYNILAIPLAAGIFFVATGLLLPAWVAGLAMAASDVSMWISALLFRYLYHVPDRDENLYSRMITPTSYLSISSSPTPRPPNCGGPNDDCCSMDMLTPSSCRGASSSGDPCPSGTTQSASMCGGGKPDGDCCSSPPKSGEAKPDTDCCSGAPPSVPKCAAAKPDGDCCSSTMPSSREDKEVKPGSNCC